MFHLFGKKNNLKFQCFTQRTRPQYRNQSCPGSDYCLMRVMQTPVITSLVSSVSDAWHKHKMPFMCRHENVINAKKLRNKGNCQLTDGQITEINDVNCIHFFLICVINSFPLTRRIQFCDPLNKNVIIHYIWMYPRGAWVHQVTIILLIQSANIKPNAWHKWQRRQKMQIYLNKLEEEAHIGREIFFSFFY